VRWQVKRKDSFPDDATVILQFVSSPTPPKTNTDGPFVDGGVFNGRYTTTGKYITDLVGFTADGSYNYTISYDDNGTERLLLDPEIVVDGNAPILNKLLKGLQAGLKVVRLAAGARPKPAAAKKAAAKAAPKKAKARKATPATKRKAKKR
jgi:hypothetical protein